MALIAASLEGLPRPTEDVIERSHQGRVAEHVVHDGHQDRELGLGALREQRVEAPLPVRASPSRHRASDGEEMAPARSGNELTKAKMAFFLNQNGYGKKKVALVLKTPLKIMVLLWETRLTL